MIFACRLVVCLVMSAICVMAQSFTASLRGTVMDPTQAAIPGAKVTVTDIQRNLNFTTETDAAGRYVVTALPPAQYRVSVEATGFQTYSGSPFTLQVQQQATIDVRLAISATETTIEVKPTSPS